VLFRLAHDAGLRDDVLLARAAMKWIAVRPDVDTVIVGADTEQQFRDNVRAFESPALDEAEQAVLDALQSHPPFVALKNQKRTEFQAGSAIGQRAAL
jgi:aryl-alcohol dehydrogenase-like predicted oxidoreductase